MKAAALPLAGLLLSALAGVSVAARAQEAEPASATEQAMSLPPCAASDGSLGVRWIVNAGSLRRSEAAIPIAEQQRYFGTPCTFLIGKQKLELYGQWSAIGTVTIRSADEVAQCCAEGVGAVLYDPESWQFTPSEERAHPGAAACRVAERVHAEHRLLIVAPAADLVGGGRERFARFLKAKIAARVARCADVFEI